MNKVLIFFVLFILLGMQLNAQNFTLKGKVIDKTSKEVLQGATVLIRGTQNGTTTDASGIFILNFNENRAIVLLVSYLGYKTVEISADTKNSDLTIFLEPTTAMGEEVVISASRVSEKVLAAPIAIQKIQLPVIQAMPGWNYYSNLANLKEVDMVQNNLGFSTFNTRGFNSNQPYRVVQYIDGIDNQSSGLNFSPGNMFGIPDIDISNIELISGPASAIYGPNAFQGVISITSKSPFDSKGLTVSLKTGSRNFMEGQLRFAQTYGKRNQFGFKLTAGYFTADDWPADDSTLNRYRVMPASPVNLSAMIDSTSYLDFYKYLMTYDSAAPGTKQFMLPGYMENSMVSMKNEGLKLSTFLGYRFNDDAELSYTFRFSQTSGVFQGNNRARLEDFIHHQHKIEFRYKHLSFKAYSTFENSNKSFDLGLTGINLGMAGIPSVSKAYLDAYVNEVKNLTSNYTLPFSYNSMYAAASNAGMSASVNGWLQPGTEKFDQVLASIITNPDRPKGSQYPDMSSFQHAEASYSNQFKWLDFSCGLVFRNWIPRTNGKIFSDTNGVNISFYEFGAYTQASKSFLNDHLKAIVSVRADKSKNYNAQFSPRAALVYHINNQYFRLSLQSAFRSPTLNDQYYLLNTGSFLVKGNITGYYNLYTLSSVTAFKQSANDSDLQAISLDPIQPEHIKTIEFGYKSQLFNKLYIDANVFFNQYDGFIGSVRAVEPKAGQAGTTSGVNDVKTGNYNVYSIYANSSSVVSTSGFSALLTYSLNNKLQCYTNYTFIKMKELEAADPLVPGFNTPKHRFNIGVDGKRLYKNLGFSVNYRWVDSVKWESVFATGIIPAYSVLDAQVNYYFSKINTTLRFGASNVLGKEYYQSFGSPGIGRFMYVSLTYVLNDFKD